jgi:peptidoglycan hydrolase CwlO-like protein
MIKQTMLICLGCLILSSCFLTTAQEEEIVTVIKDEESAIANSENSQPANLQKTDKYYYQFNTLEAV